MTKFEFTRWVNVALYDLHHHGSIQKHHLNFYKDNYDPTLTKLLADVESANKVLHAYLMARSERKD